MHCCCQNRRRVWLCMIDKDVVVPYFAVRGGDR